MTLYCSPGNSGGHEESHSILSRHLSPAVELRPAVSDPSQQHVLLWRAFCHSPLWKVSYWWGLTSFLLSPHHHLFSSSLFFFIVFILIFFHFVINFFPLSRDAGLHGAAAGEDVSSRDQIWLGQLSRHDHVAVWRSDGGPQLPVPWYIHMYTYLHTYIHMYIHTHIHTYVHTHTHTYVLYS